MRSGMTRRPTADPLFLSDAEIAGRIPMAVEDWEAQAPTLERHGLPKRDPVFGDRRCWPAVRDFLYRRAGGKMPGDGPERSVGTLLQGEVSDGFRSAGRQRARA
jgi:hypothetical protein